MLPSSLLFLIAYFLWSSRIAFCKCPSECRCDLAEGRKRVTCDRGGMKEIPTSQIDSDTQVLIITAPPNNPNDLTIGRIFLEFNHLEEIRITFSRLPAIGDSSFWPGKKLRLLDLSHNNISFLRDTNFNGLVNLKILDLSYNNIAATPSAPFRLLSSLTTLSLARNRLQALVPRFFYMLYNLEQLDLGGNPLRDIDPENLKDVKPLKRLHLAKCKLTRFHSLIYQLLPNLEEIDLRDNSFKIFSPEEFRHLRRLKYLHLDGNNLTVVVEKTFDGHNLRHLGLSRNQIYKFSPCAFCNLSVHQLDLSYNSISEVSIDTLSPIAFSVESLDLSHNSISSENIGSVVGMLIKLKKLRLSSLGLDYLPEESFQSLSDLKTLDLSYNDFRNISYTLLQPLRNLVELDLSNNQFESLEPMVVEQFQNLTSLYNLYLHSNPWACYRCRILPLIVWMTTSKLHRGHCEGSLENTRCLRCASPIHLDGKPLESLRVIDLEPCSSSEPQSRILVANSNVGVIVAVSIILLLLAVIIITVIMYRQQGAVYYTHEEERSDVLYETTPIQDTNGGYKDDKRKAFFVTLDRIDEMVEDRTVERTSIG